MPVVVQPIRELSELEAIADPWRELAEAGGPGALFRGPDWILPWFRAYHKVLDAQLWVLVGYDGTELVALAPFYVRTSRVGAIKVREVRLLGDAGARPPSLDVLVKEGSEEASGAAIAAHLVDASCQWDMLDLEPLTDPSRVRAFLTSRLSAAGHHVRSASTGGARSLVLDDTFLGDADDLALPARELLQVYIEDADAVRHGFAALRRLSRLEWADREEASPLVDSESRKLLENVALSLGTKGKARLVRLNGSAGVAIAAALIVDDTDRAVVLALAVDPDHASDSPGPAERLLSAEALAAKERGLTELDVVTGADEYPLPALPMSRTAALRLRAYGSSSAATVARTYGAVRRRVETARYAPGAAAAGARAAWSRIRGAAANMAGYLRLHLYRGELWTRGMAHKSGIELSTLTAEEFARDRDALIEGLDLDPGYCEQKYGRGDTVVLARLRGKPAGITWCAHRGVTVPELDRNLSLIGGEVYIHDVYVAPQARGLSVAPSMLEFLAVELRKRDVYKSWALIGSDNIASVRAFEKASYAPVADVIYAAKRLVVRPPDAEARRLLGL